MLGELTRKKGRVEVVSLSPWNTQEGIWRDLVIESRWVSPADQACFNVAFAEWRSPGTKAKTIADKFGLSEGRVSQLRQEFQRSWKGLQGAALPPASTSSGRHDAYCTGTREKSHSKRIMTHIGEQKIKN